MESSEVSWFWKEDIWLPPNVTWKDLEPRPDKPYANFYHLYLPIPFGIILIIIRTLLEWFAFKPFGTSLGLRARRVRKIPANSILEKAAARNHIMDRKQIQGLAKQVDMSERQVERWLRNYQLQRKPNKLTKFCETGWRCLVYIVMFVYGIWVIWDKPWTWDIMECWRGFPMHCYDSEEMMESLQFISPDVWWYYMLELSFYWSLMFSQFFDIQRKDFWQMFMHHCATICLLSFSWACNYTRIGTLVLACHDCADIFLDGAKMAKYAGRTRVCNLLFGIFTFLWIVTRLGIFPFKIIYSTCWEATTLYPVFPAYYIFNSLLMALLLLHVFWTYWILRSALKALAGH
ncbi:unnamed protein product, partial [Darwinula stevensoni]